MLSGSFKRDNQGFWTAWVDNGTGVLIRYPLPVPFTATKEQAQFAFDGLMMRLKRWEVAHERR